MREPFEIIASLGLPKATGILQVGANTGQEIDYFASNGIAHAVLIEPLGGPFATLQARCAGHQGYLPVQVLCGSVDGSMVNFHVSSNNGESSSIFEPAKHLNDFPWVTFPETVQMSTFTLDRVLMAVTNQSPEIAAAIDMLYMDVQGGELEVLKGSNNTLHKIRYIYTEVGLGGGYHGGVELTDLILFLKFYDFKLYELEINQTGWGNAFFIRNETEIE